MKKTITQIIDEYETVEKSSSDVALILNRSVGISFSGQNIYFAEAGIENRQYRILNYGAISTNLKFGSGIEGMEKNIREVFGFINGMVDSHNIEARYLNLSLNTHLTVIHPMKVQGNLTNSEIEPFMTWEFSQHILESINQYNVNTVQIEVNPTNGDQWILITGIRKKIADNFLNGLEKSKLKLHNLDVDIFCSHAVYEINYPAESDAVTVLVDLKPGIAGMLICIGHEVKTYYQYAFSSKSSPEQTADVLNHHLDNALYRFNHERDLSFDIGRVILCNALAEETLPFVDQRFNPECINPFRNLSKPELFRKPESSDENEEKEDESPNDSLVMFAEPIGAAIKILSL